MKQPLRLVRWFYPGLGVKRWLVIALIGALLLTNGITRWLVAEGLHLQVNEVIDNFVDDFFSPAYLSPLFMLLGATLVFVGMRQWLRSIVVAVGGGRDDEIVDALFERRLRHGYRIVAIGGGTGLSTLLRGLKKYTTNLTAVVTMSDDGGSSGRLQKELGVLPPGDVRNCLVALADDEALVTDLFRYRFSEGEGLSGHSFGNLFLAAMSGVTGNFDQAIRESSRVLNIKGRVLPSTLERVRLCAQLSDGRVFCGESNIAHSQARIARVYFEPAHAQPLREVVDAIRSADAIVFGPGSLYTSIIPNLLVDRIADEVAAAAAVKIYVCNVMTQPGETDDFTASQHMRALRDYAPNGAVDYAIVNEQAPSRLLALYAQEGQLPVQNDVGALHALGVKPVVAPVMSETDTVRHDPDKLAAVVLSTIEGAIAGRSAFVKLPESRLLGTSSPLAR